ncbi:hypothetical protein F383_02645 [Gossypium arboreum]|uniref:Uncharacterized protein n=1 Tax=Gossypium arboreum TaxID=29729 RepID=A0A0B0PM83_GOSAR|nr:hypothetical protein F383_02645 [Gossypium arboreum]
MARNCVIVWMGTRARHTGVCVSHMTKSESYTGSDMGLDTAIVAKLTRIKDRRRFESHYQTLIFGY